MTLRSISIALLACISALCVVGCEHAPGMPKPGSETLRPDQVLDFATLYGQNCAACHGDQGTIGAAISLANPVYLAFAGAGNIQRATASGVPGTMMPGFARSAGGMLTDQQIAALAQGLIATWGRPAELSGQTMPAYASKSPGVAAEGQKDFATFCARCHGTDGTGVTTQKVRIGSLVDPSYLSLVSDQGLRSLIVAGQPEQGMPDWRSYLTGSAARAMPAPAMTDQEITDIVAWLAAHRTDKQNPVTPGQPYQKHP